MKKLYLFFFVFTASFFIFSNTAYALVADHNAVLEFDQYYNDPAFRSAIQHAKDNFVIGYGHTSHGSQITRGMSMVLSEYGSLFSYSSSGSGDTLHYYEGDGYGDGDLDHDCGYWPNWRDETLSFLNAHPNYNMIMWSWCGQAASKTQSTMNSEYLYPMSNFESNYPGVNFIYMTGHLDGSGSEGNLHQRNEQIRNYVDSNNKILFDFADIETWSLDGQNCLDGCSWNNNRNDTDYCYWCLGWCSSYGCPSCSSCAHSQCLNCFNKGKAMWWLLAKLSGWGGGSGTTPTPTSTPRPTATATPTPPLSPNTVLRRVSSSSDDAEESVSGGSVTLSSSDLELTQENDNQVVGIRFQDINIPRGAVIENAYIEFECDEASSVSTSLTLRGESSDNALSFGSSSYNISSRADTSSSVNWNSLPSWSVDQKYQTPNLSSIVQEIVNRGGWNSGNSLSFTITGSGTRVAESYDGESQNAPLLFIEYSSGSQTTPTPSQCTQSNGDANGDGRAALYDYAVWANYFAPFVRNYGGPTVGDFNCDNYVDISDYASWANYFTPI